MKYEIKLNGWSVYIYDNVVLVISDTTCTNKLHTRTSFKDYKYDQDKIKQSISMQLTIPTAYRRGM